MNSLPFHQAIARWFTETLGEPTSAQSRGWEAIREGRHTLIAAPTGSGKTLAAFLSAMDDLFCDGLRGTLLDQVRVVYVSPLKALSADIHRNLAEPRNGIRRLADAMGLDAPKITAAVRTGDTPAPDRAAMLKTPPHILVTTPESLYLLLTAERSRAMLRSVRTVIVDEIHAVLGSRRGSHLALSLERLEAAADTPLQRIGLSATQRPIDEVARFLVGTERIDAAGRPDCAIVDEGHRRTLDVALELPGSALEAVMAHECWEEYYERLATLIREHRTTLVFVNTRRLAERVAKHLSERLGEDAVTAHHGSLSKEKRLDAEERLKTGRLQALVATSSLELGIDIGHVDLVCQIGSPRAISTFLQRVGRSGHTIRGTPKGRLFPTTRDDLVESAALLGAVRQGDLDRLSIADGSLDVLAQQIVAESAAGDVAEDDLFALVRRAYPYRALPRKDFDAVIEMLAQGFATRRGRRGALIHRDEVHRRVRGRRSARLSAITSGGAIPDNADYRVVLEPDDLFLGTVNEDFAIESMAGDVFQLGNTSWRIARVLPGVVRVQDARGQPPTIPFWLGEAPARSAELSKAVSELRRQVESVLQTPASVVSAFRRTDDAAHPTLGVRLKPDTTDTRAEEEAANSRACEAAATWLEQHFGISPAAAAQIAAYLGESYRMLGVLPTQDTLVLERFFDESGGMQLVLHAPFGNRVNRAWGLALRKRFCRQFNFELQAAATEEGLLLSLGPQHSFPLADVFRYLHPASVRDILVQAFLDAPVFQTRWRWNATISLAVPRNRNGKKVPPALQRMQADDLMAAVFPDAAACLENIPGDREIPDHPLVNQTVRDCLEDAMDLEHLQQILGRIHAGTIQCVSRDMPEPSPLSHEMLSARPYSFLDDAPLEERRAQAVYARRASEPRSASDLGALDPEAIARVVSEAWPAVRDADELHDALLTAGFFTMAEVETRGGPSWAAWLDVLANTARATRVTVRTDGATATIGGKPLVVWVTAERLPELEASCCEESSVVSAFRRTVASPAEAGHYRFEVDPLVTPPPGRLTQTWTRETALVEILRGRLSIVGPTTAAALAWPGLSIDDVGAALQTLESEGVVLRGAFTPGGHIRLKPDTTKKDASSKTVEESLRSPEALDNASADSRFEARSESAELEWCDRRLLARIHRYTLNRLRAEIEPVSPAEFMRFLFEWQHVSASHRTRGVEGLRAIADQLDGFEAAADAWERDILSVRVEGYERAWLDMLCFSGHVAWARLSRPAMTSGESASSKPVRATPIALYLRANADAWQVLRPAGEAPAISPEGALVLDALRRRGALFGDELSSHTSMAGADLKRALGELVAAGLVASDAFAGLRAMIAGKAGGKTRLYDRSARSGASSREIYGDPARARDARSDATGRWSALAELPFHVGSGFSRTLRNPPEGGSHEKARADAIERQAWALLRRYGVVFRRLLARETNPATWRELTMVYRRLEARGEIRGGRFVAGMSGEQFALPDAVTQLREVRRSAPSGALMTICAADPLNLSGLVTPGDRVPSLGTTRIVYCDGTPLAALEGDYIRQLSEYDQALAGSVATALAGRPVPAITSGYIGRAG